MPGIAIPIRWSSNAIFTTRITATSRAMRRYGSTNRRRPPEWPPSLRSRIGRNRISRIGKGFLSRKPKGRRTPSVPRRQHHPTRVPRSPHARRHSREAAKRYSGQPRHKPPFSRGDRSTGIKCKRHGKHLHSISSKHLHQGKPPRSRDAVKGKTRCVNRFPFSKGGRSTGIKCNLHGKRLHNINSKPPRSRVAVRGRRRSGTQVTGTVRVRDETSNFVMTLTAALKDTRSMFL